MVTKFSDAVADDGLGLSEDTVLLGDSSDRAGEVSRFALFDEESTSGTAGFRYVYTGTSASGAPPPAFVTIPLSHGDGKYLLTVEITATQEDGTQHMAGFLLNLLRDGGTVTGDDLADPVPTGDASKGTQTSDITFTFSASSGNVRSSPSHSLGENVAVTYATSYTFIPFPAAP